MRASTYLNRLITSPKSSKQRNIGDLNHTHTLWALRAITLLSGHYDFLDKKGFSNDALAIALGFEKYIDEDDKYNKAALRKLLKELLNDSEKVTSQATFYSENYEKVANLLDLSATEVSILQFAVALHTNPLLETAIDFLGDLSLTKLHHAFSVILNQPIQAVRQALSPKSTLISSGLIVIEYEFLPASMKIALSILSQNFVHQIESSEFDFMELLQNFMAQTANPTLDLDDYNHVKPTLDIITAYLKRSIINSSKGVNICIYGPPGTGKTELSGVIAKSVHAELFAISCQDEDGEAVSGKQRLRSFNTAQRFLKGQRALLLFDEMEDVFNDGGFFDKSIADKHKSWINRILEQNTIPTLWVSNDIRIDQAFIRRFDITLELTTPPIKKRKQIIKQSCSELLDEDSIAHLASVKALPPAVINRSAKVIQTIKADKPNMNTNHALKLLVENTLKAQRHGTLKRLTQHRVPKLYDPSLMSADMDMVTVASKLAEHRKGRMCLYGPPGTGKTAYGLWLADELGAPLNVKKGSDLISMWIGGTEENIAEAFEEAERDEAVLLIDEVDSFLQDRRGVSHSWEITAVNEMLIQIESFDGIFIASTNLMTSLDQASLRRFDLKVKFDYLKPEQAWTLFSRHCEALNLNDLHPRHRQKIYSLDILTPGDFAVVARQVSFKQLSGPDDFLSALIEECLVKEEGRTRRIGFV